MCSFSASPSTHLLLPSRSYPWLPMVVSFFLTHLLLEVASPLQPSFFLLHSATIHLQEVNDFHWWRRSKAYKLHMELHHYIIWMIYIIIKGLMITINALVIVRSSFTLAFSFAKQMLPCLPFTLAFLFAKEASLYLASPVRPCF